MTHHCLLVEILSALPESREQAHACPLMRAGIYHISVIERSAGDTYDREVIILDIL